MEPGFNMFLSHGRYQITSSCQVHAQGQSEATWCLCFTRYHWRDTTREMILTHSLHNLLKKKIKSNFKTTMHMKSNSYLMSSAWFFIWHAMWETSKPFSLLMHVSCGLLNSGIHFVICWGWIGFWHHILWMLIYRYAV